MFSPGPTVSRTRSVCALAAALVALPAGLMLPVPDARGADGVYGGKVARSHYPLVLTTDARGQVLKGAIVDWLAPCESGNTYHFTQSVKVFPASSKVIHVGTFETKRNARGAFSASYSYSSATSTGSAFVTMSFTGKLKPGSASGTLKADVMFMDVPPLSPTPPTDVHLLDSCTVASSRWSAARHAGLIYGGKTSQDEPLVLRVSADHRKVAELDVGWTGRCEPSGWIAIPDVLVAFPLDAHGVFGETFTQRFTDTTYDYDLHGTVGRAAASGTLDAKATVVADGSSCPTGRTTWTSRSG